MNTTKGEIQSLLQYHLYVIEKIRKGIDRAEREGAVSQEEVERRLAKWTSK